MTITMPLIRPHTAGLLTLLATTGFPVGDGKAPDFTQPPYLVLTLITSPPPTGPLSDYQADATFRYQVTAVGTTEEMAQKMSDKARAVMIRENLTVSGRRVMMLQLDVTRGDVREERGVPEPIFSAVDQFLLMTTPP